MRFSLCLPIRWSFYCFLVVMKRLYWCVSLSVRSVDSQRLQALIHKHWQSPTTRIEAHYCAIRGRVQHKHTFIHKPFWHALTKKWWPTLMRIHRQYWHVPTRIKKRIKKRRWHTPTCNKKQCWDQWCGSGEVFIASASASNIFLLLPLPLPLPFISCLPLPLPLP